MLRKSFTDIHFYWYIYSRCRGRGDDETRFVYGRYRQPTGGRHQYPHHQHQHHQHMAEEESIYETADHDRGADQCGDTPDSER